MFDKHLKPVPYGLYFALEKEKWSFAEKTINTIDIDTGETAIPAYFEVDHALTGADNLTCVVAIVKAPTIADAWNVVTTRFNVQRTFWTANLPHEMTADDFKELTAEYLTGRDPRETDPVEMM